MSDIERRFIKDLIGELKTQRDQARVQLNLGKKELKDEYDRLTEQLDGLGDRFESVTDTAGDVAGDVWESLKLVGGELKEGFRRILTS